MLQLYQGLFLKKIAIKCKQTAANVKYPKIQHLKNNFCEKKHFWLLPIYSDSWLQTYIIDFQYLISRENRKGVTGIEKDDKANFWGKVLYNITIYSSLILIIQKYRIRYENFAVTPLGLLEPDFGPIRPICKLLEIGIGW